MRSLTSLSFARVLCSVVFEPELDAGPLLDAIRPTQAMSQSDLTHIFQLMSDP